MFRIVLVTWLLLVPAFGQAARADDGYIATAGEATRAIGKIASNLGPIPRVHTVRITERAISLLVEGSSAGSVEEWRIRTARRFFINFETVSGPASRPAPAMVAEVAKGFFTLGDLPLASVDRIAADAIVYAQLEEQAEVKSIEIARRVSLLPVPAYGAVIWSIYVASPHESATIHADAQGRIIGGDLSNTRRARTMNFLDDADWPKAAAMEAFLAAMGPEPLLREMTIYPKSVQVKASRPSTRHQTTGYIWDLSGLTRSPVTSPILGDGDEDAVFALGDVDLAPLTAIRTAARKAWGNDGASLNSMMLRRFSDGPGRPEMRWSVHFTDPVPSGEIALFSNTGTVEVSVDGTVRAVNLPTARQPHRNWLDPAMTRDALARIGQEFGGSARFAEITVDRDSVEILAEAPDVPGTMRSYSAADNGITAERTLMPWDTEFRPERLYKLDDLGFFGAERLAALTASTFARLQAGTEMAVSRYTFSIGQQMAPDGSFRVPSPDGKVTLEIRLESPDGVRSGRVTYASDGSAIDVVLP